MVQKPNFKKCPKKDVWLKPVRTNSFPNSYQIDRSAKKSYVQNKSLNIKSCQFKITWVVVSNIFDFQPYLGKWSNLTNMFQLGWNHQPVTIFQLLVVESSTPSRIWQFQLRLSGVGLSKHWPLGNDFIPQKLRETLQPLEFLKPRFGFNWL